MKKLLVLIIFICGISFTASSQKVYATFGPEMIFSLATIDNNGNSSGNILRWAPVLNLQLSGNVDFGKHFGLLFGVAVRNVGFIYDWPDSNVRKKYRNYNIGIPVGIKIGKMNGLLFYGGYEIEFPFAYKEKTFIDNQKTKFVEWFTPRVPAYYNSVFFGVQFPYGFNMKFKYYFSEFFNQDYSNPDGSKPYQGFQANVWYISIGASLFRNSKVYYKENKKARKDYY